MASGPSGRWIGACVLAIASACGGGTAQHTETTVDTPPPPPPASAAHASGSREVTARVGRRGGVLELANGSRLEIDDGVFEEDVELTMTVAEGAHVFDTSEYQTPLGPGVAVEPAVQTGHRGGIHFSIPEQRIPSGYPEADLALAVEETGAQREHFTTATQTHWQMYPARHVGGRFVSDLDDLEGHRLQFGISR